jgi:hypothetical protein
VLSQREAAALLDEEPDNESIAPRVEWEDFDAWLCDSWQAGDHFSIVAPTGAGKTFLIRYGLLPCWRRYPVFVVQCKPKDPDMKGLGREVKHFPTKLDRLPYETRGYDSKKWDTDPEWFRLRVPAYRYSSRGEPAGHRHAKQLVGGAIDRSFWQGEWVLVIDEVRAIAEPRQPSLGLEPVLENAWQRGRTQPLTIVAATQQPANVPSSFYDQPTFVAIGKMLDVGRFERLGEIGGDTKAIKAILPTLQQDEFLIIHRPTGEMIVTEVPPGRPHLPGPRSAIMRAS